MRQSEVVESSNSLGPRVEAFEADFAAYCQPRFAFEQTPAAVHHFVKLKHLDAWTNKRRHLAAVYRRELESSGVRLLAEPNACKSVYHIFPLFTDQRDELRAYLHAEGISTGVHPIPVHLGYQHGGLT